MSEPRNAVAHGPALPTFAWTSPYDSNWVAHYYGEHAKNIFGKKLITAKELFARLDDGSPLPDLLIMGNFIVDRSSMLSVCRARGINTVHTEDGFFPHYSTVHADPLGFCWESSLSRSIFRECSDVHRRLANTLKHLRRSGSGGNLPPQVRPPFILWPLQLIGDQVNKWDMGLRSWVEVVEHFRSCLPPDFQLVLKLHPRGKENDLNGIKELARRIKGIVVVPAQTDLTTLLYHCAAAAGVNSSVLYEARLIYGKPTYVYGKGWFSNHEELFLPVRLMRKGEIPGFDLVATGRDSHSERLQSYSDWFLANLIARQIDPKIAEKDGRAFREAVHLLSYTSFMAHGEDIFLDAIKKNVAGAK